MLRFPFDAPLRLRIGKNGARERWRNGDAVPLAVLASAFALKLAYSRAGAEDLAWVLVPTGWLAAPSSW